MVHWLWLVAAFGCGGATSLVALFSHMTNGFDDDWIKLWKATLEHAQEHSEEIERKAGVRFH